MQGGLTYEPIIRTWIYDNYINVNHKQCLDLRRPEPNWRNGETRGRPERCWWFGEQHFLLLLRERRWIKRRHSQNEFIHWQFQL